MKDKIANLSVDRILYKKNPMLQLPEHNHIWFLLPPLRELRLLFSFNSYIIITININ